MLSTFYIVLHFFSSVTCKWPEKKKRKKLFIANSDLIWSAEMKD